MTDLITRLSKLDAPDREVDAEIYILFNIPAERAGRIDYSNGMVGWWPKDGPYVSAVTVPAFTASVDAAIALAERVLPGWAPSVGQNMHHQYWYATLSKATDADPVGIAAQHPTSGAIALVIALLRAKEAST